MPTSLSAMMHIRTTAELLGSSPVQGAFRAELENASTGRRWTAGQGVGMVDRVYRADRTLAAAATHNYNTLAAGALTDIAAQLIDLDELKGIIVTCLTGSIKIVAPASTYMRFFGAAADFIALGTTHTFAMDFGATGLDVTTNSLFDIVDTAGGAGSTYSIEFFGAN